MSDEPITLLQLYNLLMRRHIAEQDAKRHEQVEFKRLVKLDSELKAIAKHDRARQRKPKRGGKEHPNWPIRPMRDPGELE